MPTELEPGRGRRPRPEVLPQGGRSRRRPSAVDEDGVPEWLWRSVADEAALEAFRATSSSGRSAIRAKFSTAGRLLDVLGLEARLLRHRERRARSTTTRCARCSRARSARRTRRSGSTPACIGRTASPDRRKGTITSIRDRRSARNPSNAFEHPQVRACFILSIEDDLVNEGGIFDGVVREARIFKGGSGSGANFSKIRALPAKNSRAAERRAA